MGAQAELARGKQAYAHAEQLLHRAALSEEDFGVTPSEAPLDAADPQPAAPRRAPQPEQTATTGRSTQNPKPLEPLGVNPEPLGAQPGSDAQLLDQLSAALRAQHSVWHKAKVALLAHLAGRLRQQLQEERRAGGAALQAARGREASLAQQLRKTEQDSNLNSRKDYRPGFLW